MCILYIINIYLEKKCWFIMSDSVNSLHFFASGSLRDRLFSAHNLYKKRLWNNYGAVAQLRWEGTKHPLQVLMSQRQIQHAGVTQTLLYLGLVP